MSEHYEIYHRDALPGDPPIRTLDAGDHEWRLYVETLEKLAGPVKVFRVGEGREQVWPAEK